MNVIDPYLAVRAGSLYLPIVLAVVALALRRPDQRLLTGAMLTMAWNLPAILALHVLAVHQGWWRMDATGGLLLGMPVDLWLGWAVLWGPLALMAFRSTSLVIVAIAGLAFDLAMMPAAYPVVRLGSNWLTGEFAGIALCLIPAQLLGRWTAADRHLNARASLQVVAFGSLVLFLLPAIATDVSASPWRNPFSLSLDVLSLIIQLLALPGIVGVSAVQEFATRGGGTPVPFDAPKRIVTTGPYAYIANPMQASCLVVLAILAVVLNNVWVGAIALMSSIYSAGIAQWDEHGDLRERFGTDWTAYRATVRHWIPRWRPAYSDDTPIATLYVSEECGPCQEVANWYRWRGVRGLTIVAAEAHPTGGLTRITYESNDGLYRATGIDAIARALEHIHLGWAYVGCLMRLPVVSPLLQLLADASGAAPNRVRDRARPV